MKFVHKSNTNTAKNVFYFTYSKVSVRNLKHHYDDDLESEKKQKKTMKKQHQHVDAVLQKDVPNYHYDYES